MMNKGSGVQECDATELESGIKARNQKKILVFIYYKLAAGLKQGVIAVA